MHQHGAYYYCVPRGLEPRWDGKRFFRLGATRPEAYRTWAARLEEEPGEARTIGALLDRYALEVVPTKAPKTQGENTRQIARLRKVFGALPLVPFPPRLVYQYVDRRGAKVAAARRPNREHGERDGDKVSLLANGGSATVSGRLTRGTF